MKKIESLTEHQIAQFPNYVREWTAIGTCTDAADRPRAENAIRRMYEIGRLDMPRIIWCDGPLSMLMTKHALEKLPESVGESVRKSVWESIWASVGESVVVSVWASVWESVVVSVWASVRESVWESIRESVGESVWESVGESVWESVFGQHEASWLAFYRFFHDECGLADKTSELEGLWELAKSCGCIMPYRNICFASERHNICHLDERGVIHSEKGPAILYPDGFAIHAWHGTRVPAHWIESRESLDPMEVLKTANVDQRHAGCQIIGWAKMADKLDRRIIDGDPESDMGALIELTLPGLPKPGRFLMARCPRNGPLHDLNRCGGAWTVRLHPNAKYSEGE